MVMMKASWQEHFYWVLH